MQLRMSLNPFSLACCLPQTEVSLQGRKSQPEIDGKTRRFSAWEASHSVAAVRKGLSHEIRVDEELRNAGREMKHVLTDLTMLCTQANGTDELCVPQHGA